MQEYHTVSAQGTDAFIEKKSRFIGHIKPVVTEQEAAAFIAALKGQYWDATHNCSAYRLRTGQIQRYSDDGEPQGTAGVPILEVLRKEDVYDAVIVVTRYFGGIMLGAGGLVRAYSRAAKMALDAGGRAQMHRCALLRLTVPYPLYDRVLRLGANYPLRVLEENFADTVCIRLALRADKLADYEGQLTELSGGTLALQQLGEQYIAME